MKYIQSQFSLKQVVIIPVILTVLVCLLISIISFASIEMTGDGIPLYKTPIWIVLLFIALLLWNIRYYLKTFKRYTFLDKGFEVSNIFGKEFYSWSMIKQISIIENNYEKILWHYLEEDTLSIKLNSGKTLELFSKYYSNIPAIRTYITKRNDLKTINSYNEDNIAFPPFKRRTFKGSFILSFNGFLALFLILTSGFMLIHSWPSMTLIGLLFLIAIPFSILIIFGFQSYYFILDRKSLFINNHIFFTSHLEINLEEIRVIYFEQKFRKEPSIRIINKDFSMVSFQSNSLKNKQWKSLIQNLKQQHIQVKDDLFYE